MFLALHADTIQMRSQIWPADTVSIRDFNLLIRSQML